MKTNNKPESQPTASSGRFMSENNMEITDSLVQRTQLDWRNIAGEYVSVEPIGNTMYGFCSELAALRLFHKYKIIDGRAKADYSENRKSWFFRLEV